MTGENERDDQTPQTTPPPAEKPLTRGERLRREREAKAKAKAEKRGREAELREEKAIEVAERAREVTQQVMRESGGKIAAVLFGVLLLLVGIAVAADMMAGAREERARALAEADAVEAPAARAEALRKVAAENEGKELAVWARLGEGSAQLEAGDAAAAEAAFADVEKHKELSTLERRLALEGLAAARLAKGDAEGAKKAFERLAEIDDDAAKNAAELGLARILAGEGKTDVAREIVSGVIARLKQAGREGRGYTFEEAEALASSLQGG